MNATPINKNKQPYNTHLFPAMVPHLLCDFSDRCRLSVVDSFPGKLSKLSSFPPFFLAIRTGRPIRMAQSES